MLPQKIKDRTKRINIKCKRRKNLLKKAMELGELCDQQILLIIKDTEFNKFTVYNSLPDCFPIEVVKQLTDYGEPESPLVVDSDGG